jgi:glycosyltransferase involved in cell wall biosynthesis/2-polyprenyl-3-methyl-5-hydroxy-6-metoxy-1,4-benzoquinol methylase
MQKTISIVTHGLPFNGNSINETALGGSESAVIYIAREMAVTNDVTVYCNCDKPGVYDGVDYRHVDQFNRDEKSQVDVLIISRFAGYLSGALDAKLTILWCHDIAVENMHFALGVVDRVFCLSAWQKKLYCKQYGIIPYSHVWQTTNGYDQRIVTAPVPLSDKKNNFIYASRPERGLKLLLERIWPEVLAKNENAILNLCGYDNANISTEMELLYAEIDELLETSINVKQHGSLTKPEYYELLSNCSHMLYPTDFPEISCINAIEAQYNGCNVVTSAQYALTETVKTPTKVRAEYGSDKYVADFMKMLDTYHDTINVDDYSWENVAKSWNAEIDSMFTKRFEKNKDRIIDNLVYHSDIVAAWKLTGDQKYRDMLDKGMVDNLTKSDFIGTKKDEDYFLGDRGLKLIDVVGELITPDKKLTILDLGCNEGILSLPLMKRYADNIEKMVMYDSSTDVLQFVEESYGEKYPQIEFINDDVRNVLKYSIKPDVVIVGELLEHIEDTTKFLDFLMQLSTGDTVFYFTVPRGPWESISECTDIHHVHHFELADIKQIFNGVNMTIAKNNGTVIGKRGEPCDNWLFWFVGTKETTFGEVDYADKWLKTKPYKKVSVCLITKNEEDNISRCLKSVKSVADEIIMVDTGSTDDTLRIAAKFVETVHHLEWAEEDGLGSFSHARNHGIDLATGDYILYIDADEELLDGGSMFKFIGNSFYDAVVVTQMQMCSRDRLSHMSILPDENHPRLFKNDGIRFTGVIHEYPTRNGENPLVKVLFQQNAKMLHYGYSNINTMHSVKNGRNTPLVFKNAKTHPDRPLAKYYVLAEMVDNMPAYSSHYLDEAYTYWKRELKFCPDRHIVSLSKNPIQEILRRGYVTEQPIMGKVVEQYSHRDAGFFAFDAHDRDYFEKMIGPAQQ